MCGPADGRPATCSTSTWPASTNGSPRSMPSTGSPSWSHELRPPPSMPRWPPATTPVRWPACRSPSRTTCALAPSPPPRDRASSRAGARLTTAPWSRDSERPERFWWARPTSMSSPWVAPPRTRRSGPPATPTTSSGYPGVRAEVVPRRWPPGSRRSRSAAIRAAPSANPPRCAGWSGSSPPTGACHATGSSPWPARSIRSVPSPLPWPTPHWPMRS